MGCPFAILACRINMLEFVALKRYQANFWERTISKNNIPEVEMRGINV